MLLLPKYYTYTGIKYNIKGMRAFIIECHHVHFVLVYNFVCFDYFIVYSVYEIIIIIKYRDPRVLACLFL